MSMVYKNEGEWMVRTRVPAEWAGAEDMFTGWRVSC